MTAAAVIGLRTPDWKRQPPGATDGRSRHINNPRRQTTHTVAWLNDMYRRGLLELDPPYQRRSVWNESYQAFFIETVLQDYPAPALFLHEAISDEGATELAVVDGKQRLTSVFRYIDNEFALGERTSVPALRGKYFEQLTPEERRNFWSYQFSVEYLPDTSDAVLSDVFDRINRNVARLTPQELRNARFGGRFATAAERLLELMLETLPPEFPRIARSSRAQMKDLELVAHLMLLLEQGPRSLSQEDLDAAYSEREEEWEAQVDVEKRFVDVVSSLAATQDIHDLINNPSGRRLRNQADFYSLFGAVAILERDYDVEQAVARLQPFLAYVVDDAQRQQDADAKRYYDAARSASNDTTQREERIAVIAKVLKGEWTPPAAD